MKRATQRSSESHRPMMFGVAYAMLGEIAEAEDVVQEAYLRWHRQHGTGRGCPGRCRRADPQPRGIPADHHDPALR
ncbi:MAG: sigma factor [Microthrixaceae bacterium]